MKTLKMKKLKTLIVSIGLGLMALPPQGWAGEKKEMIDGYRDLKFGYRFAKFGDIQSRHGVCSEGLDSANSKPFVLSCTPGYKLMGKTRDTLFLFDGSAENPGAFRKIVFWLGEFPTERAFKEYQSFDQALKKKYTLYRQGTDEERLTFRKKTSKKFVSLYAGGSIFLQLEREKNNKVSVTLNYRDQKLIGHGEVDEVTDDGL